MVQFLKLITRIFAVWWHNEEYPKNPIHLDKRKNNESRIFIHSARCFSLNFSNFRIFRKIVIISQIRIRAPLIASCSNWLIFLWIPKFSSFVALKLLTPIRAIKRRLRKLPHQNLKFLELFDGTFLKRNLKTKRVWGIFYALQGLKIQIIIKI